MEAIPGAAVLFCFVLGWCGAAGVEWCAVAGGMPLRDRLNVIARHVGCSCAHT